MTQLKLVDQQSVRRARSYRAAAAVVCVLGLAATVFFHAGPTVGDSARPRGLSSMPAAAALDDNDYLRTLARDPSVPRAQDVFAAKPAAQDDQPQPPTF